MQMDGEFALNSDSLVLERLQLSETASTLVQARFQTKECGVMPRVWLFVHPANLNLQTGISSIQPIMETNKKKLGIRISQYFPDH